MSYRVVVEFGDPKPSSEDVRRVLRGFDQDFESSGSLLRLIDPYSGDSLSIDIGQPGSVKFEVPLTATFRSVATAYSLARALEDKYGGRIDRQLGGIPSLDLAEKEWKKLAAAGELSKIFGGSIPEKIMEGRTIFGTSDTSR